MLLPYANVTLVSCEHKAKAPNPMLVTLSGIVTLARLLHKTTAKFLTVAAIAFAATMSELTCPMIAAVAAKAQPHTI